MSSIFGRGPRRPKRRDDSDGPALRRSRFRMTRGTRPAADSPSEAAAEWCKKANALLKANHADEALPLFDKAIELNPRETRAWTGAGLCLDALGRHEEAVE